MANLPQARGEPAGLAKAPPSARQVAELRRRVEQARVTALAVCKAAAETRERSTLILAAGKQRRAAAAKQRRLAAIQRGKLWSMDSELELESRERSTDQGERTADLRETTADDRDRVADEPEPEADQRDSTPPTPHPPASPSGNGG